MTQSICWLFLDADGRVEGLVSKSKPYTYPEVSDSIVPYDAYSNPARGDRTLMGALWNSETNDLVFDSVYDERQAALNA